MSQTINVSEEIWLELQQIRIKNKKKYPRLDSVIETLLKKKDKKVK